MEIKRCNSSDIDELYNGSALTFEGTTVDDDNLKWLINWFESYDCKMINEDFYVITGKQMNEKYHLTGDNAYKNELTILCIKLDDLSNVKNIIMPRFEIGGRWFDDVVDNNISREQR